MYKSVEITCFTKVFRVTAFEFVGSFFWAQVPYKVTAFSISAPGRRRAAYTVSVHTVESLECSQVV